MGCELGDRRHRLGGERRAAEVGVQDDPGGVDHPAVIGARPALQALFEPAAERGELEIGLRQRPAPSAVAQIVEGGAQLAHDLLPRVGFEQRRQGVRIQHPVDFGETPQQAGWARGGVRHSCVIF